MWNDEYFDPITGTWKKKKTNPQKMREALTPAKRRRIMEAVGNKCEIRGCKSKAYEVHHIKPVSEGGTNVGSNLVVLCANHHKDAHNGKITRTELREVVKNRSEKKKREIRNILRDRKKVGKEKSTSSKKAQSPFDRSSFSLPTFDFPSFDSPFDNAPEKKGRKKKG